MEMKTLFKLSLLLTGMGVVTGLGEWFANTVLWEPLPYRSGLTLLVCWTSYTAAFGPRMVRYFEELMA